MRGPFWLETETNRLSPAPGIYEIVILNQRGYPKKLRRMCGTDGEGTLYIGRSSNLRRRLKTLRRMLFDGRRRGHMAGLTFNASPRIRAFAPPSNIGFRYSLCEDVVDREDRRLKAYFRKFGEVPPLNGRAEFITRA